MEKGYDNYLYSSDDFDQLKNKVNCSDCHGQGHTMDRHKEGRKTNRRACDTAGRNHRLGTLKS
jgi:hypothetical protein